MVKLDVFPWWVEEAVNSLVQENLVLRKQRQDSHGLSGTGSNNPKLIAQREPLDLSHWLVTWGLWRFFSVGYFLLIAYLSIFTFIQKSSLCRILLKLMFLCVRMAVRSANLIGSIPFLSLIYRTQSKALIYPAHWIVLWIDGWVSIVIDGYDPNSHIITMWNSVTQGGKSGAWQMFCFKRMEMVQVGRRKKKSVIKWWL